MLSTKKSNDTISCIRDHLQIPITMTKAKQAASRWYRHWPLAGNILYSQRFNQEQRNLIPALPLQTMNWAQFGGLSLRDVAKPESVNRTKGCQDLLGYRMLRKLGSLNLAVEGEGKPNRCLKLSEGNSRDTRPKPSAATSRLCTFRLNTRRAARHEQVTRETAAESVLADFKCSVTHSCNRPQLLLAIVLLWVGSWPKMTPRCSFQATSAVFWTRTPHYTFFQILAPLTKRKKIQTAPRNCGEILWWNIQDFILKRKKHKLYFLTHKGIFVKAGALRITRKSQNSTDLKNKLFTDAQKDV